MGQTFPGWGWGGDKGDSQACWPPRLPLGSWLQGRQGSVARER